MLQEGFKEAIHQIEIVIRECVTEDDVLYLQTVPQYWSVDSAYVAKGLVDIL